MILRRVIIVALVGLFLAACSSSRSAPTVAPTATSAAIAAIEPTATPPMASTPTPRPTSTPRPIPTPAPIDLAIYLPTETDLVGPFSVTRDGATGSSPFGVDDGFVQGRMRELAKPDPHIVVQAYCAEYRTPHQASVALDRHHEAMMAATDRYTLAADDDSQIDTPHAYLAGGVAHLPGGNRPVAIAWYHIGRVTCFNIVLGVPGGDGPPRGAAIDAANLPLARLAQASAPTPTPIPGGPGIFEIGEKITYEDGFSITVRTVEDPVVVGGEAVSPRPSIVLVAVEVEACAGPTTTDAVISPLDISVTLDDNTRADRSYTLVREPVLDTASLFSGECLHGWVTFERHWKPRPVYVVIDIIGYETVRVKAR